MLISQNLNILQKGVKDPDFAQADFYLMDGYNYLTILREGKNTILPSYFDEDNAIGLFPLIGQTKNVVTKG